MSRSFYTFFLYFDTFCIRRRRIKWRRGDQRNLLAWFTTGNLWWVAVISYLSWKSEEHLELCASRLFPLPLQDVTGWNVTGPQAAATVLTMRVSHDSAQPEQLVPFHPEFFHSRSPSLTLGPSTSFCSSNKYGSKAGTPASSQKKPAEVSPLPLPLPLPYSQDVHFK